MLLKSARLIPRYNWDYGLSQWALAVLGAMQQGHQNSEFLEDLTHRKPIFTNSGRTSLYAILKALDLTPGAGIAVPLYCCPVVFEAIEKAGLKPVFIDVDMADFNISAIDLLKKKETFNAVVAVHMFGRPADMDEIATAVGDMPVIEDCAQSLFSLYKNRNCGTLSKVSFFSFRSGKYISAGEGSFIFCSDRQLRESVQRIVDEFDGWSLLQMVLQSSSTYIKSKLYKRPLYGVIGYPIGKKLDQRFNLTAKTGFEAKRIAKSNLNVINHRMNLFHQKISMQRDNSHYLLKKMRIKSVSLPKADVDGNFYQFALRLKNEQQRNNLSDFLFENGIDTAKYLDDIVDITKKKYKYQSDCPIAEKCSKTTLIVPNHYTLSRKNLDHIAACINRSEQFI